MKIAIVIPTLKLGGAEKIARDTALCFERMGHDVSIILFKGDVELQVPKTIKIYKCNKGFISLLNVLYTGSFDFCISYMERANLLSSIATKILHIEHCATVHTAPDAGFRLRSKKNQVAISFTYRLIKMLNTKVVGVCKGIVSDLKTSYGINNSYVIPNFIDTSLVNQLANTNEPHESFDFIFVGRLSKIKGCNILIKALGGIKDEIIEKKVRIGIIGDGPERENIEALIERYNLSDAVTMLGSKDNPYPYIKNSTYLVVPSYAEGFGLVVLEGLSLGTRIIYSKCDFGPQEIISENFNELESLGFKNPNINSDAAIEDLKRILHIELNKMIPFDPITIRERIDLFYSPQKTCEMFLSLVGK
ncbi:glycosyltransferase [Citrobacter sp. OP27]